VRRPPPLFLDRMILVAPTAFKGTMGAAEVAAALARGLTRAGFAARELPLSDGGPGLLDALAGVATGEGRARVAGPRGAPVDARFLWLGGSAVLESAAACGLTLVAADSRDPERADTAGVAELLLAAASADRIVLGLGGSATVDGGAGMARRLGWRFEDAAGRPVALPAGLARLARIRPPAEPVPLPPVRALADVRAPLTGPGGAAAVFGPQKGAAPAAVARLAAGLERLAARLEADVGRAVAELPGGGAAGGLGAGAVAFLGAELIAGSPWVLETVSFDAALAAARAVVTGEGSYDAQTPLGKVPGEVVRRALAAGVPVVVVAGRIDGALPPGVHGLDGGGRRLDAQALESLAETRIPRLLGV
jgi:glycerate 2-kinase